MDEVHRGADPATTSGSVVLPRHDAPTSGGAQTHAHSVTDTRPSSAGSVAPAADIRTGELLKKILGPAVGFLANITVMTALLVYFGWRRAETQAKELGIDESILGMSTREYLLRSVGPVLVLLVGIGAGGLIWLSIERRLTPVLRGPRPGDGGERRAHGRAASLTLRLLGLAWLLLPAVVIGLGNIWPSPATVLFPVSIGAGVLLWLYARHCRWSDEDLDGHHGRGPLVVVFVGLLVLVTLFWTASNYAEVLGRRLADDFARNIGALPGVAVYSEVRIHLDGPGVGESALPEDDGTSRYRYSGLRLLEHTGGKYFLVSDGWTTKYGVVFILRDDDRSLRFDFVRDSR